MVNETINKYWKDWAGLVYLLICLVDFFIGPTVWNLLMFDTCAEVVARGDKCDASRWEPLTLQMGGMFHLSFAGILGVHGWKKKEELEVEYKIKKIDTDGAGIPDTEIREKV